MCTGELEGVRYVITKFSRMDSLPYFVTHGAPLRARELRYKRRSMNTKILIIKITTKTVITVRHNKSVLNLFVLQIGSLNYLWLRVP